ncbi:hypothetical protein MHPYR_280009 [uncultured Mycobacterium sp.]|uniref:Uncharacterized protein n=1 Tax=uncultured Mycobacterium sp. TaxID=171292 RepID=A0A1Y5PI63_9MYCO|nr:hypothetical protein MHPYR_280009 [uncultured Mycobacterium sp.]
MLLCVECLGQVPQSGVPQPGVHPPVSTMFQTSLIQLLQGRQDLNLQPAVLETAALPVELRPSAKGCPT